MTTTLRAPTLLEKESQGSRLSWAVADIATMAKRNILAVLRTPEALFFTTLQPIMFVLLFTYVFGSAIRLPGSGSYHQYLISGMFGMTMAGSAPGTAVGLCADMTTGLIDRFRSLPINRAAVLAGRSNGTTSNESTACPRAR